jgi:hypothetical protein
VGVFDAPGETELTTLGLPKAAKEFYTGRSISKILDMYKG